MIQDSNIGIIGEFPIGIVIGYGHSDAVDANDKIRLSTCITYSYEGKRQKHRNSAPISIFLVTRNFRKML